MEKNRGKNYYKDNRNSSVYRKANISSRNFRNRKKADKTFTKLSGKRVLWYLFVIILIFVLLMGRIGYIQIAEGKELREREQLQSIASSTIAAKRGVIYDCNKKALAISADVDTISVNPKLIVVKEDGKVSEEKTNSLKEKMAKEFSELFSLDYNEILTKLNSDKSTETIAEKVDTDKVTELKKWMSDTKIYAGINIDEDTKRYYPFNNVASNLIGFCGSDNQGLDGVELEYDDVLKGTNGKLTTAISASQTAIPDSNKQYIAPENGSNLYLTIDSTIQAISEKYLKQAVEENNCKRGGNVIIENPETGEILAMATYPDYNLNTPYEPNDWIKNGFDQLSQQEKTDKLYSMWRNRAVLDTYEPGSTFKTIIASVALENGITTTDKAGDFYCSGIQKVADSFIKCAEYPASHGSQSLRQALENSCNPAFIQLGQRIGKETLYKYLELYGFFNKTGIDLPSEGTSSFWNIKDVGPVELATMSFGQRFNITPMQLVKAVSAIANGGYLITPHVVKSIENTDTGTITNVETNVEKQVISKQTSDEMKDMMKDVVEVGGGTYAQVEGYTVGGKTGTSEANPSHPENGYVSSFLAIAPVENTKLVVLLTLYAPQTSNHFGGKIAAPAVSQILSEVLPYLDIPSNETTNNKNNSISTPNLKNKTLAESKTILDNLGLKYEYSGNADDVITEQVPASGTQLTKGGIVMLYSANNNERKEQEIPDLKGVTYERAKNILESKHLNISSTGSGIVIAQNPKAGNKVEEGTVISVTLQEQSKTSQN